jgi:hypothetical protein
VICKTRVKPGTARLSLCAICLRVRPIRRAGKTGVAIGWTETVRVAQTLAALVAGGHAARIAARIAAQTAVSGAPAASSVTTASTTTTTVPTAIAACARIGRHGRKGHEGGGNPLHSFHFCFLKKSAQVLRLYERHALAMPDGCNQL